MSQIHVEQILAALHVVSAAVFVGSNVFVEFVFHRLKLIPPADSALLGDKLGGDVTVINGAALVLAGGTGLSLLFVTDTTARFGQGSFWSSGYGLALASMIGLWLTLVISACLLVYLRSRTVSSLSFDSGQEDVAEQAEVAISAADWMQKIGWYNLAAGIALILTGGFLKYGGFA